MPQQRIFTGAVIVVGAAFLIGAAPAAAQTFSVTNTNDSGAGSLRQAISDANATPGADVIQIRATGTVMLQGPLDPITDDVTITGPGADRFTVNGGGPTLRQRIFAVPNSGTTVSISGLTATNGSWQPTRKQPSNLFPGGGAIFNAGTLTLDGVAVSNSITTGPGGGIASTGTLTLRNSTVSGNTTAQYGGGVEIASGNGTVQVPTLARGRITSTTGPTATITNTTITGNQAGPTNNGAGGGVDGQPGTMITLTDSTVSNNTSATDAGGVRIQGTGTIARTTVSGNTASGGFAGGIGVPGAFEEGGVGMVRVENSTVTGNRATLNGGGVGGYGSVTIVSSTIASNSAPTGANLEATGSSNFFGPTGGTTTVQNAIVASPAGGGANCASPSGGALVSKGNNLEDDAAKSCSFTASTDQAGVDPRLGALASNGGFTQTRALLGGSPAIDRGTSAGLTANAAGRVTDQRGVVRPIGRPRTSEPSSWRRRSRSPARCPRSPRRRPPWRAVPPTPRFRAGRPTSSTALTGTRPGSRPPASRCPREPAAHRSAPRSPAFSPARSTTTGSW